MTYGTPLTPPPQSAAMAAAGSAGRSADSAPRNRVADDNQAHAGGADCARCGRPIQDSDGARRRADTGEWVHDVCPRIMD